MKLKSLLLLAFFALTAKTAFSADGNLNTSTKISFEVVDPESLKPGNLAFVKLVFTNPEVEYASIQCFFDYPEGWTPEKFSAEDACIGKKGKKSFVQLIPEGRLDENDEFDAFTVIANEPDDASFRIYICDADDQGKRISVGDDALLIFAVMIPEEIGDDTDIFVHNIWISTGNPDAEGDGAIDDFSFNIFATPVYDLNADKTVASVLYYNLAGVPSTLPFDGLNVVLTTYTDGTRVATKILK